MCKHGDKGQGRGAFDKRRRLRSNSANTRTEGSRMAEQAELDATLARLEAALAAATREMTAAQAIPDLSSELDEVRAELAVAQEHIKTLEADLDATRASVDHAMARAEEAEAAGADAAKDAEARLASATSRAEAAEQALSQVPEPAGPTATDQAEVDRLRDAVTKLSKALDDVRSGAEGAMDASLKAELETLRAARDLDLAEMQALLAELEPMLERAHA